MAESREPRAKRAESTQNLRGRRLGLRLAIDDFGTGYSSLSYLQRFPVDVLEIDKSFVDGIAHSATDAALARTIIALGDTLALRTVAEGIEDADQRALLRELGCAMGQGYRFAKPMAAAEVEARLSTADDRGSPRIVSWDATAHRAGACE